MKRLLRCLGVLLIAAPLAACAGTDVTRVTHDVSDAGQHVQSAIETLKSDPVVAEAAGEGLAALEDVGKAIAAGAGGLGIGAVYEIGKDLTSASVHVEAAIDKLAHDPKLSAVVKDAKAALKDAGDILDAVFHKKK